MLFFKTCKLKSYNRGLLYKNDEPVGFLKKKGSHFFPDFSLSRKLVIFDMRSVFIEEQDLQLLEKSGLLKHEASFITLAEHERAIVWKDGDFLRYLGPGRYAVWSEYNQVEVDRFSLRDPWLINSRLDTLHKKGVLENDATVLNITQQQRAIVFVDNRFERILTPGLYAITKGFRNITYDIIDTENIRYHHENLPVMEGSDSGKFALQFWTVDEGEVGLVFYDGNLHEQLEPGFYAFWKNVTKIKLQSVGIRETQMDISGQEIMTADKVTLRLNALLTYKVADPLKAVNEVEDYRQTLYREAQMAIRATIGTRNLDDLLSGKDNVAKELHETLATRAQAFGIEVLSLGIRDLILPGEMKDLLNKVTEAKKAAEANLISRREETAAMRSQLNTAKLMENNPTLMRLKELETLERISDNSQLQVILGEKGLADRIVNVL